MTEKEFNSIINSRKIDMGNDGKGFLITKLPQGIGTKTGEYYQDENQKINYLKRYSDAINNSNNQGTDTEILRYILNQMENLQGNK